MQGEKSLKPNSYPLFETLEPRVLLDGNPVITEFLADNSTPWYVDNASSDWDWIEIHNPTTDDIDLTGWHLTDDDGDLERWTFPATTLHAGEYLVVFASGLGGDPAHPDDLHTNFGLSKGGDYVALVKPQAASSADIVSAYDFPDQEQDVSYGLYEEREITPILSAGDDAYTLIPGSDIGPGWTATGYAPSGWTFSPTGVGYETTVPGFAVHNYQANIALADFATAESVIATPSLQSAAFSQNAGVINYFNTGGAGWYAGDLAFPGFTIGVERDDFVVEATGWISIPAAGQWTFGVNSDDGFLLTIEGATTSAVYASDIPAGGDAISFYGLRGPSDTIGVFSFASAGEYPVRLVMYEHGGGSSVELWAAQGSRSAYNAGEFRLVGDTAGGGLAVQSAPVSGSGSGGGFGGLIQTDVETQMKGVNASAYLRVPFTVADPLAYENLTLRVKYDDGFVAYLNGVEVARRNAPEGQPAYNAAATAEHPNALAAVFEEINISNRLGLLQAGPNVLAIHGLNYGAGDGDFLILPELIEIGQLGLTPHYFATPSPGEANLPGFVAFVADTTFSVDRGFFDMPFDVAIACDTPDATIYYTTDGSAPSATNGAAYDPASPIRIDTTTVLRAVALRDGWEPSNVDTQTYLFLDDVLQQSTSPAGFPSSWGGEPADYAMDPRIVDNPLYSETLKDDLLSIPTMSLVMAPEDIFGASGVYSNPNGEGVGWERAGSVELFYPEGYGATDDGFQVNCGVRMYGGVGRNANYKKHAFRLLFKGVYGPTKLRYPLFGEDAADGFDTIILRHNFNDGYVWGGATSQYIRDEYVRQLQLALGDPAAHGTFVHLYVNGLYWGLYNPTERADQAFGATYFGGEKEQWDAINAGEPTGDSSTASWNAMIGLVQQGLETQEKYQRIQGNNPDGTNNPAYECYLDVRNYINYMLVNFFTGNSDWPGHNWYAARGQQDSTGFKSFAWDSEWCIGMGSDLNRDMTGANGSIAEPYAALRQNPEFRLLFADMAQKAFAEGGPFYVDPAHPQWDPDHPEWNRPAALYAELADFVERAMVGESARWGDVTGGAPYTLEQWRSQRDWILNTYMAQRSAIVLGQLRGAGLYPNVDAPSFRINGADQQGGAISAGDLLSLYASSGTIYYTLDGTDPREVGGGVNPGAVEIETGGSRLDLVGIDHVWSYDQSNTDLPDTWHDRVYPAEGGWPTGQGLLYVESASLAPYPMNTPLTLGPMTFYFRTHFDFNGDPSQVDKLELGTVLDDGAIIYLNGEPVLWVGQNVGADGHGDIANRGVGDATHEGPFIIPTEHLRQGDNVLAVEVHQTNSGSTDVVWGMDLSAVILGQQPGNSVVLDQSRLVKARVRSGSTWSALNEAAFLLDAVQAVRVTEIMYNPAAPTAAEIAAGFYDNDEFEYLEIQNIGAEPIALQGMRFSEGITFTFPAMTLAPGGHALVVRNQTAFETRYGTGLSGLIAGEFLENTALDNNGEPLRFEGPIGGLIHDFTYRDGWHDHTDGQGFSLVVVDPAAELDVWDTEAGWRPSAQAGGSPGQTDPDMVLPGSVIINEVLVHTDASAVGDWIEFRNTTGAPIDIGGWYLSDTSTDLTLYEIPSGTEVPENGYLVLDQVNHFGGVFALSELGETVYLSSRAPDASAGGYRQSQRFGAADREVTFGLYTKSTGGTDFVALVDDTPGYPNAEPVVGSVVINEIMYNPATGDEFIELLNLTGDEVLLYDPAHPANRWQFTDGIVLEFPEGASIAPHGYALVVPTDPAAFRAARGVDASVPIYGPYTGELDNGSETIELSRPGEPEPLPPYVVPYIRAERVTYGDRDRWPLRADGRGASLNRKVAGDYSNDVSNWVESTSGGTPGAENQSVDYTPPSVPGGLTATPMSNTELQLTWDPSTDPDTGIAYYRIYRNGTPIGTADAPVFSDIAVKGAVTYSYQVSAVNTDGTESERSVPPLDARIVGLDSVSTPNQFTVAARFTEPVTPASAEDADHYRVTYNGGTEELVISGAVLQPSADAVMLQLDAPLAGGTVYTLVVNGVVGQSGTPVVPNAMRTFGYYLGGSGTILHEYWLNIGGSALSDLTNHPDFPDNPTGRDELTSLELPVDQMDYYGTRLRGYLHPPASGEYTFWIASDDNSQFWISTDDTPDNAVLACSVSAWTAFRQWNQFPEQQSAPITLQAGQRYYIEVLQKEGAGGDNLSVRWQLPGGAIEEPIPGLRLSPYSEPNVTVGIEATDPEAAEQGADPGTFTVRRTSGSPEALTVYYLIGGQAGSNDYEETLTGSVDLPAGVDTATITITPVDDVRDESDEAITLTLTSHADYAIEPTANHATVTIVDNDEGPPPAEDWLGYVDNHWENPDNWSESVVPGIETTVVLDGGATHEPVLYQDHQVKGVDFVAGGWTLDGTHTLTVGADGIDSVGANTVNPQVALAADSTWTITGADTLHLNGALDGSAHTLTKDGGGTLALAGAADLAALDLQEGTIRLADSGAVLVTRALSVDTADAALDVAAAALIIDYDTASPLAGVTGLLRSGQDTGPTGFWDGMGIRSSAAANDPTGLTTLGVLDNAEFGWPEMGGVAVDETSVLVKYTYFGDADLDGSTTGDDYFLWLAGFDATREALAHGGEPALGGWLYGDFDHSGDITGDDYFVWLIAFDAARAGATPLSAGRLVAAAQPAVPQAVLAAEPSQDLVVLAALAQAGADRWTVDAAPVAAPASQADVLAPAVCVAGPADVALRPAIATQEPTLLAGALPAPTPAPYAPSAGASTAGDLLGIESDPLDLLAAPPLDVLAG